MRIVWRVDQTPDTGHPSCRQQLMSSEGKDLKDRIHGHEFHGLFFFHGHEFHGFFTALYINK